MRVEKSILVVPVRLLILGVLLVSLLSLPQTSVSALNTVFVSPTGSGSTCSQAVPCTLGEGLNQIDADGTLYARYGTYNGTGEQVVLLDKTIDFLGGWDGSTDVPVVRDPEAYPSILDGQNARRGITIVGGSTAHPTVDGWTIINGNASGLITNCQVFVYTTDGCGGGILVYQAEPEITHNKIYDNVAVASSSNYGGGGGIYVNESEDTLIRYNLIHHNDSNAGGPGWGGGIYIHYSGGKTSILDNEIYDNEDAIQATSDHSGAGVQLYSSDIQVHGNYIHGNDPNDLGYWGSGLAVQYSGDSPPWIDENIIVNNHGYSAVAIGYAPMIFQQNSVVNPGVTFGIYIQGECDPVDHPILTNNFIAKHDYNVNLIGCGSGDSFDVDMRYNTLADGEYGVFIQSHTHLVLDRSILSDHSSHGIYMDIGPGNSITASNLLLHANTTNYNGSVTVSNVLTGDPHYVDAVNGDYHLLWNSAAINVVNDTGVISEDIDDDPRPVGGGSTPYDVGADEYCWSVYLPATFKP